MSGFNAKQARAKRPCPLWVDAFQRDTQHLEADEVGAYMLILMAMWTRESCDFPDDDTRLARVSRVSVRLWKSRIGPQIREFLTPSNGVLFSKRLREEATYVERQVQRQSDRKAGEKSDKSLENNDPPPSTDTSTDEPPNHPSQQPNNPTLVGGGGNARASFRERVLEASGHDASGVTANGRIVGNRGDFAEFQSACDSLEISEDEAVEVVAEVSQQKRDGPANSLSYFIEPLRRYAGLRDAPPVTAIVPSGNQQPRDSPGMSSGEILKLMREH